MAKKGGRGKIRGKGKKQRDDSDSEDEQQIEETQQQLEETNLNDNATEDTTTTTAPVATTSASASTATVDSNGVVTNIVYCKVCTLPIEYCEFHDRWAECEKWLAEFHPKVRQELIELRENDKNKNKKIKKKKASEDEANKKQEPVIVTTSSRSKRKHATIITGVENYGVNHKDASKFFAKKLSAGASVVKKPVIAIEIQGDVHEEVIALLQSQFGIPQASIKFVEEKKKKKQQGATTAASATGDGSDEDE